MGIVLPKLINGGVLIRAGGWIKFLKINKRPPLVLGTREYASSVFFLVCHTAVIPRSCSQAFTVALMTKDLFVVFLVLWYEKKVNKKFTLLRVVPWKQRVDYHYLLRLLSVSSHLQFFLLSQPTFHKTLQ